jgi:5-deoxy-D-glucuronate isomerase
MSQELFELPTDKDERIRQGLAGRVCTTTGGSYIRRSSGRRMATSKPRYSVHVEGGTSFLVRAWTDSEAVAIANKHIAYAAKLSDPTQEQPR